MEIPFSGNTFSYSNLIFGGLFAFVLSAAITWIMRVYALRKAIFDIPNERSSHCIPTPRGGGVAIVLTFILSLLWLRESRWIESGITYALIGGGLMIAAIGYCDDVYSSKARTRIFIHFLAAVWALHWLGGYAVLDLGSWKIHFPMVGYTLALIGIIWCINLYNFMDGIDGLAGSEGIFVGLGSGIALVWSGTPDLALVLWLLTASIAGFTIWNWPPAKIFLGDVGSGFLGYVFAVIGLYTINKGLLPISFWWVILAIFLCDATFTLVYRAYQGKPWYSAHREHAYQRLIAYGATHKQVTASILFVNCFLLLPAAYATIYWPTKSLWFIVGSIICLWLVWTWINRLRPKNVAH
jgi:Fuc2NAc and GlcNAc transferase